MKKKSIILAGILSPLYYQFVFNLVLYVPYSEKYSMIKNAMSFILPVLPGIVIAFLLIRSTFKEYLKALGVCLFLSIVIELIYSLLDADTIVFRIVTGQDEFYYGEALTFIFTYLSYILSYFIGSIIAGCATLCKQMKNKRLQEKI